MPKGTSQNAHSIKNMPADVAKMPARHNKMLTDLPKMLVVS